MAFFGSSAPDVDMSRLFVGGLVGIVERRELERVFGRFGRLEDVWVARKPPGFAFVQFAEQCDAEEAVRNLNNTSHFGTTIRVEFGMRDQPSRGGRGRRSSPPRRGPPLRGGPPPRGGPPSRPDHDRYPPRRSDFGRDYGSYRVSPPPPERAYRGSPPRLYRSPPRSSYQMSPPQRSYRSSPPPSQSYYSRSPQRTLRASPPPMRPMYRESPPAARPSYRAASPTRRYDYETASRPLPSRDYNAAAPVYSGRSPVRAPRGYSPVRSSAPSFASSAPSYSMDMSARYPGVHYRSRSRSPVGRGYY